MDEQEKKEKLKAYSDRFVRWQQLTIGQMSFTNNLVLGFNLGFLGFFVTQSGLSFSCNCWLFTLQVLTLSGLGISFITGTILVVNRLKDFRKTSQLIKKKKERFEVENNLKPSPDMESINASIRKLRTETDKLGKTTWTLLNWQIWTFMIGTILGIVYIITIQNTCG